MSTQLNYLLSYLTYSRCVNAEPSTAFPLQHGVKVPSYCCCLRRMTDRCVHVCRTQTCDCVCVCWSGAACPDCSFKQAPLCVQTVMSKSSSATVWKVLTKKNIECRRQVCFAFLCSLNIVHSFIYSIPGILSRYSSSKASPELLFYCLQ